MPDLEGKGLKELYESRMKLLEIICLYQSELNKKVKSDTETFIYDIYNELLKQAKESVEPTPSVLVEDIYSIDGQHLHSIRRDILTALDYQNPKLYSFTKQGFYLATQCLNEVFKELDPSFIFLIKNSDTLAKASLIDIREVNSWFETIGIKPSFYGDESPSKLEVGVELPTMEEFTRKYKPEQNK